MRCAVCINQYCMRVHGVNHICSEPSNSAVSHGPTIEAVPRLFSLEAFVAGTRRSLPLGLEYKPVRHRDIEDLRGASPLLHLLSRTCFSVRSSLWSCSWSELVTLAIVDVIDQTFGRDLAVLGAFCMVVELLRAFYLVDRPPRVELSRRRPSLPLSLSI
jgi:hypothetical protein